MTPRLSHRLATRRAGMAYRLAMRGLSLHAIAAYLAYPSYQAVWMAADRYARARGLDWPIRKKRATA